MDFFIKPSGKFCVVVDSAGTRHGGPLSFEAAQAKKDELDAAEREQRRTVNDARTIAWTARRYTAIEWYGLLAGDRTALKRAVRKRWSAATPHRFTIKDAYLVATAHRSALTQHMRREIEENWEGDPTQRLERFDREWAQIAARTSKSDPSVLAVLLGTKHVPRLRLQLDADIKSDEEYRKYREANPRWLGFAAMEEWLAQKKRSRDTKPAAKAKRRSTKSLGALVRRLTRARMSQKEISDELDVSVRTVSRHQKPAKSSA